MTALAVTGGLSLLTFAPAFGNALQVTYQGQSPPNTVPRGQQITYTLRNENVDDGSSLESDGIGTGFYITINGTRVPANSGQFTSAGCSVDFSFPEAWACNNLPSAGSSQTFSFTWVSPDPGTSIVRFEGLCQEVPAPSTGTRFCQVSGQPWGSVVATVTTEVQNQPPNGAIDTPVAAITTINPGDSVNFTGTATDPENDTPFSYLWSFDGGATNSILEDPGAVVFNTTGTYTVSFSVTDAFGATDPTPDTRTVVVSDPGCIQLSAAAYSVSENVASVTITATRTEGSAGAVSVDYATSDGTATAGVDYAATAGTLSWADGETTPESFTVSILDDDLVEGDEAFDVSLSNPIGGARLCTPSSSSVTIVDYEDHDGDGVTVADGDCDDDDASVNPFEIEVCDDKDNDCNDLVDDDELGEDTDGDGVRNVCDNCREAFNTDQLNIDEDSLGNACDNCLDTTNEDQLNTDGDSRGDACDNCPETQSENFDDRDSDEHGDVCDNCIDVANTSQHDLDDDQEGDECDLDDGVLFFRRIGHPRVRWQTDPIYSVFNLYRGSLAELISTGVHTQPPGSNAYADRFCDLGSNFLDDSLLPAAGEAFYWLVAGEGVGGEEPLGDGAGVTRPNSAACP